MRTSSVNDCLVTTLNKITNPSGNLTVVEGATDVPFDINRIYYLYDIPGGEARGGHAHKALKQLIVSVGGSFDVVLNDGTESKTISLNRPYMGLLLVPGIWRELQNFSSGSVCLVLASHVFDEADYIRNYDAFVNYKLG